MKIITSFLQLLRPFYKALFYPFRSKIHTRQKHHASFEHVRFISEGIESVQISRSLMRIFLDNELCAASTVSAMGEAHIHAAFFSFDRSCRIFFLSENSTRHAFNIAQNPSMAMSIASSANRWGDSLRGVQLWGSCKEATGADEVSAIDCYSADFPAFAVWYNTLDKIERFELKSKFYVFSPIQLKLLDEPEFGEENYVEAKVQTK